MRDLEEILEQKPLELPIRGKVYTLPVASLRQGLEVAAIGSDTASKMTELQLWQLVLGDVYQQMVDDDLPFVWIQRAGQTALADIQAGRDIAEQVWEASDSPEYQAVLAAAASRASKTSTSTGSAKRTRSRATTRHTNGRPASSSTTPRAARMSGRKSSASGD